MEQKAKSNKKLIIGCTVVVLIAIAIVGVVLFNIFNKHNKVNAGNGNVIVEDESDKDKIKEKVQDGMFSVKMNTTWNFEDGTKPSTDAILANSTANKHPAYCEVSLQDTGEIVYTSPVIPVGSKVDELKLDKDLDAGTYKAICKYNILDDEEETVKNTLSVTITIVIKK